MIRSNINVIVWCSPILLCCRCLASRSDRNERPQAAPAVEPAAKESWFKRMLPVRNIDPGKESHSTLLSDKDVVYELLSKLVAFIWQAMIVVFLWVIKRQILI